MYLVVFYVGEYVWVGGYTKSKTSELSPPISSSAAFE
jgi:hypothetical protein